MDFLFVAVIIGVLFMAVQRTKAKTAAGGGISNTVTVIVKKCPPHQWFWQSIVDQHGNSQGERIACKVCGPIASQSGREE